MLGQGEVVPMLPRTMLCVYGIRRRKGKSRPFALQKPTDGADLPFSTIFVIEEARVTLDEAIARAEAMVKTWREMRHAESCAKDLEATATARAVALAAGLPVSGKARKDDDPEVIPMMPGAVVTHSDGDGQHYALILSIEGDEATALFLTSSIWGGCRPASESECHLLGLRNPKQGTNMVKVVRPLRNFYITTTVLPPEVLSAYQEEFS